MGFLSGLFHPGRGYKKGQEALDRYYREGQTYLQPYHQNAQSQYGNLNTYINSFMNPQNLLSKWISEYQESPAAKNAEALAQEHGLNAASSMGLGGSNTALNAIQRGTSQIALNDRQNYLDNLMQKYLAGAQLAQGIYGSGLSGANSLANNANTMGQNSAQMAFNQENAGGNMLSGILGLGGSLIGGALSGPIGGALVKRWNLAGGS